MSIINVDGMKLTPAEIAKITNGELYYSAPATIRNISLDSRKIEEDTLFIAIKGERFDGHDYIGKAFEAGAAAIIAERIPYKVKGNIILVDSSIDALAALAREHRRRIDPLCVGITGSVGKTTTKQFVYGVLSQKFNTHKTEGNFNNEIGLPISTLRMKNGTEALVLEMGMSNKGEIEHLSKIAEPDIAIITNIGTSHLENLKTREGIRDAKMEITKGMNDNGILVLNGDEPLLSGVEVATYVSLENENSDYRAINITEGDGYFTFDIATKEGIVKDFRINIYGRHNVYNSLVAYAVGKSAGVSDDEIKKGLLSYESTGLRQNIFECKGYTFIEDCYNAAPESMIASLGVLKTKAGKSRRVAVFGDMLELGENENELHKMVGIKVAKEKLDLLCCFGKRALNIAKGAIEGGMDEENILCFQDVENDEGFAKAVEERLLPGDTVIFKASRGIEMERIVEKIKE